MRQIKSKSRVNDYGEVFTAEREVKAMCDLIPQSVWDDVGATFLEPSCGNGNFVVEILRRKLERCQNEDDVLTAYASIYAIDILADNCAETRQRMIDMCPDFVDKAKIKINIECGDALQIMKKWEE